VLGVVIVGHRTLAYVIGAQTLEHGVVGEQDGHIPRVVGGDSRFPLVHHIEDDL
jgi:hypothetical protein